MRRILVLLLVVCSLLVPAAPVGAVTCPTLRPVAGTERLHEFTVAETSVGEQTVRVLLPDEENGLGSYPVLYLLHGAGDTYAAWTEKTDVEGLTEDLGLIVVMPDGGHGSDAGWYSDWHDGSFDWETYHIDELVPLVDACLPTMPMRSGRAVAGLSMGGFGAMSYAARHPDLFAAAGSFSGAVDTADGSLAEAAAFEALNPFFGTPDDRVWGPYETNEVEWRNHNPPDLSGNLRWTDLWLRTGNGVPMPGDDPRSSGAEAGVSTMNRLFHRDLESEGIDHVFLDRGYGTHEWHYWEDDLALYLDHLFELPRGDADGADVLDDPPDAPDEFDHRSAAPDAFDVWGWSFGIDDDRAQEFLELADATRLPDPERGAELVLRGSGTIRVVSAAGFDPGETYEVTAMLENATSTVLAHAGDDGRLRFEVPLGPPHAEQQYTLEGRLAEASDPGYWRTATVEITPIS